MSKHIKSLIVAAPLLLLAPMVVQAVESIEELLKLLLAILGSYVIPLIIAVAVVVFLYGVIKYVTSGGDEEKRKEARNTMIYGLIALFIMLSVWGLLRILAGTFGTTEKPPIPPPELYR